jgi:Secretion system C-terminal sorting domain
MRQLTTHTFVFALILLIQTPISAQITLEATYPTTDLRRISLPISGEKWYYADDSARQIRLFNADHSPWKTVSYPKEVGKKVSLDAMNMPVSETIFNRDSLLEFVWRFTDSLGNNPRVKILNEGNDSVYYFPVGYNYLTVNELDGSSTKLFVENRDFYDNYKTSVFSLPIMLLEKTYERASNMHRQKFNYAGEKYYFKNAPQKALMIYNPNHTLYKSISIPVPTNGGTTYNYDPVFFADDKIFINDTLVEYAFSYDLGLGYGLSQIVNENDSVILKVNSNSSFVVDKKIGQPDKIFLTYNLNINTVNTNYNVLSLPNATFERTYSLPIKRILLKKYGAKYLNLEYGALKLFNTNHSTWKTINLVPNSGNYFAYDYYSIPPIICDSIVNQDSTLEIIWTEHSTTSSAYQLRITTENGTNLATIPNARFYALNQMDKLETKLITKTWNGTKYMDTKVWRFTARTPVSEPTKSTDLDVLISPNPFNTSFTINNSHSERPLSIKLFDAVGRLILSEKITPSNATLTPPSTLPSGVYFLELTDGEKRVVKRLVKIK